jgi:hypothetical protein
MNCALAGAQMHHGRPLNRVVRSHVTRYLIGMAVAPLVPVVIVALLNWASGSGRAGDLVPVALFSYLGALVLGVPMFFIFRKRGWLSWWQLAVAGLVAGGLAPVIQLSGFIMFAIIGGASLLSFATTELLAFVGFCAVIGGTVGLAFWAIAQPKVDARAI